MAIPKYNEMYEVFLKTLQDGHIHTMKEEKEAIIYAFSLSDDEVAEMLPSGKQRVFDNRVGWCRTYLKKAGLIDSPSRAHFVLTDEGRKALLSNVKVDDEFLKQFKSFREFINAEELTGLTLEGIEPKDQSPEEILEAAWNEVNNALASDLMDEVMKLSPTDFEKLVVKLLLKMGYGSNIDNAGLVTQASCDGGIDGIIKEDQLGFSSIYIQAKLWKNDTKIDRPEINKFVGALLGKQASKGLFITTAQYTNGVKKYVETLSGVKVVLIDGMQLTKLMIKYNLGVSVESVYEVKKIDTDFFAEEI